MGLAPAREGGGPLVRATEVEDPPAGLDGGAVDDPHHHRRHLAGGHRHHRLVEHGDAVGDLAEPDQGFAQPQSGDRRQVRVRVQAGDAGGLGERGVSGVELARLFVLEGRGNVQVAVDDGVLPCLVGVLRRAGQPAPAADRLVAEQETEPEPEGTASGAIDVTGAKRLAVRRVIRSTQSASRPVRYAQIEIRSRSARPSGSARSASASRS